jgi:Family of unknown function (DUF5678)
MAARDWSQLYKKYRGQWVALKDDEMTVIASGPTLREVIEKASRLGYLEPHVVKMPADLRIFVGLS